MYRIAIIEDDAQLCQVISGMLDKFGYEAVSDINYRNLPADILNLQPHLILLDINLPYYDGYFIARELRQKSNIPIIMISARETEAEQIRGFDMGADDYLVKPFSMEMLKAKINVCLRRVYGDTALDTDNIVLGNFVIDQKAFTMRYDKKSIELTKNELKIMVLLSENCGQIVKREQILHDLWDDMTFVEDNTLNVNISRIKNKLEQLGLPDVIRTKRGEGYILELGKQTG